MRLFTRHLFLASALAAATLPAFADETVIMPSAFSYTYADLRYFGTDSDAYSVNQQGGVLAGSYGFLKNFYVTGDALYGQSKHFSANGVKGHFETETGSLRLGAHYALTPILDVLANAGAVYGHLKGHGGFKNVSDDNTGYIGEVGLRMAPLPKVEIAGYYDYQHLFKNDSTTFTGELQYHVTPRISVIGAAAYGKSADVYTIGGRYSF